MAPCRLVVTHLIVAAEGSDISIHGGNFTCRSSVRGGFLYAEDNTRVRITGGLIENNVATKRGAGVSFCCWERYGNSFFISKYHRAPGF